jgi:hypothetical protein
VALAREVLRGVDHGAKFGCGTDLFFAELNRQRPAAPLPDLIVCPITPQAHAFDNASMTEGLEAIPAMIETARQFSGAAQLAISPVSLRRRDVARAPAPGEMPPQADQRQMSLFGAGWTMGCLKYLAESAVDSATFYETSGWLGVMEVEDGSPSPRSFRSLPGSVFPLYHVLADVGDFAGGAVIPTRSSDPLNVEGFVLHKGDRQRVLLANLSPWPQRVALHDLADWLQVRSLDETNAEEAMRSPETFRVSTGEAMRAARQGGRLELELRPYAIVRIDGAVNPDPEERIT